MSLQEDGAEAVPLGLVEPAPAARQFAAERASMGLSGGATARSIDLEVCPDVELRQARFGAIRRTILQLASACYVSEHGVLEEERRTDCRY
jgi:hypothetical protein